MLYQYQLNITDCLILLIPLIIGVAFLVNSIRLIKSKEKKDKWNSFVDGFFKIAGIVVFVVCIGLFSLYTANIVILHQNYQTRLENDDVCVVEGYVEEFYPMPYEGHDTEHFYIDGVYFEYSDYNITNGYHKTASHGGVITHNGQHLKIKFVEEEFDGVKQNIILQIEEIHN
ncbi:MAG: hypothetical protein IJD88_01070 [Clostridia bacterium]|nr:hypothetical protein [Clostridia bacterium]